VLEHYSMTKCADLFARVIEDTVAARGQVLSRSGAEC
jgi:hypothetical protein